MWLEIVDSKWKEFLIENELPPAEKERQRKRELFPSQEDFSRLAKGLMEDDDETLEEENPWHDSEGKLGSPSKGNVYSLSKPAVEKAGWDSEKAKKGISTGNKNKKGETKLQYKFGMPNKCGRKAVSGADTDKDTSCRNFPKKYSQVKEGEERVSREYVKATFEQELEELKAELIAAFQGASSKQGGCSLDTIIKVVDKISLASKGKAFVPPPKPK